NKPADRHRLRPSYPMPTDRLDAARIRDLLGADAGRFSVEIVDAVDSTSACLMNRAEAPAGTVLAAEAQRRGRGRLGRAWHSAPGESLTFSLLWRFARE